MAHKRQKLPFFDALFSSSLLSLWFMSLYCYIMRKMSPFFFVSSKMIFHQCFFWRQCCYVLKSFMFTSALLTMHYIFLYRCRSWIYFCIDILLSLSLYTSARTHAQLHAHDQKCLKCFTLSSFTCLNVLWNTLTLGTFSSMPVWILTSEYFYICCVCVFWQR